MIAAIRAAIRLPKLILLSSDSVQFNSVNATGWLATASWLAATGWFATAGWFAAAVTTAVAAVFVLQFSEQLLEQSARLLRSTAAVAT